MKEHEIASLFNLDNKVAVIAGGSRGIGLAIAEVYALAGAKIVVSSRKQQGVDEAAEKLRGQGAEVLPVAANVSVDEDRVNLVQQTMDWAGKIDILVNNAGTNPAYGPLQDVAFEAWGKTFKTNLDSAFRLAQLVFHSCMKDNGGAIVNTASVAAFTSTPMLNTYNITKAAMVHMTRALAHEWGPYGIRVNALAPGVIRTQLSRALWESDQGEKFAKGLPLRRLGEVDDIRGAALLLASDAGAYITGEYIVIDGGELIGS
ncbi:MAG: SDR family oxidoreductase [Desulfobacteraceae bacterium]|nr:SDR family oxidoreductase [Desulfobacteraceae bacterium]